MLGSPEHCRFGGVSASTAVMPPLTYNAIPALLLPSTLFFPSSSHSLTFSQPPSTHRLYLLSRQLIQTIFSCDSGLSARCVFSSVLPRVLISQHHHSHQPEKHTHSSQSGSSKSSSQILSIPSLIHLAVTLDLIGIDCADFYAVFAPRFPPVFFPFQSLPVLVT